MAFDYLGAKQDGYTDEEIAAHLASSSGFDLDGAVTDGYTYSEISQHLSGVPSQREAVDDPSARDSTIVEEFERGLSRLGIDYSAFVSSFSNPEEAATEAIRKGEEVSTRLGRPATLGDTIKAYEEEGVIGAGGEVLRAIPRVTAQQLPTTATVMAGTTGAAALMPVPQLKPLAGYLGGFTALYPQLYAQNIQRQAEVDIAEGRDVDINRTKAAVAAVGQTAAEQLATYFTLGKGLVSRLLGRTPKPRGVRSSSVLVNLAQDSLKGVARGAAAEIPTEISQQIIERAQAGLDVMSDEAYAEYGEAAYMAGIAGGTIGGVSGAATPIFTPTQTPPEDLPGDLPTTPDLSEITPETITPDLPEAEPTTDIAGEDAVSRLKNLGEAYDEDARRTRFQEQLEVIAPNLRGVLKGRGLDDIGINIAYSIDPQVLGRMRDPQEVEALFDADTRTIFLGADRIRGFDQLDTPQLQQEFSGLVNHEMVHAVKRMKLWTDAEWAVLENAARRQINADGLTYLEAAQTSYSPESVAIQNEEAVAELIRDTLAGRTGLAGQPLNLMQRLIEFFRKMGNALTGTGYASFNQVINDIDSGVLGARPRGGTPATPVATPMIVGSPALASRKPLADDSGLSKKAQGYLKRLQTVDPTASIRRSSRWDDSARRNIPGWEATIHNKTQWLGDTWEDVDIWFNEGGFGAADTDFRVAETNRTLGLPEDAQTGRWVVEGYDPQGVPFTMEDGRVAAEKIKNRHRRTNYDELLKQGYDKESARELMTDTFRGTPLASRRLKSDAQAQQQLPLPEGMTGAEVAAEESRLAEEQQRQEQARTGVAEARRILEDDQQPLASRRQAVPRPPRDAAWEQRAREQGFDTDTVYYHGTGEVFDEFDPLRGRAARTDTGVYLSVNPLVASTYAGERVPYAKPNVLPVYTRLKNPITVYADGNYWSQLGPDIQVDVPQRVIDQTQDGDLLEELGFDRGSDTRTEPMGTYTLGELFPNALLDSEKMDTNDIARWARQQQGVDGVIFEDIIDRGITTPRGADRRVHDRETLTPTRNLVVFDAKNIRSVNAQFDPAQTESPKLLASRGRKKKVERLAKLVRQKADERIAQSPTKVTNKVKIIDIGKAINEAHLETYGRKLDPTVTEDQLIAAKVIADDIKQQMTRDITGQGWYDADVQKAFMLLSEIPGLESLRTNEDHRVIWSAITGPTSNNMLVPLNTRVATASMLGYLRSGKIPTVHPVADTVTEGIPRAGWGANQKAVEKGMQVISKLIEDKGVEGFADWWLSPHTKGELTAIRKAAGLSGPPSGVSGTKDSYHLGAMIIGDKTGRFSLNINGYEGTTKDVWYTRSYNRAFGDMLGKPVLNKKTGQLEDVVQGAPRNNAERRQMEAFNRLVLNQIKQDQLSEADAQAILWFHEQNLYTELGVLSVPGSFSEGAEALHDNFQIRSRFRRGDEGQIEAEPGDALEGWRGLSGRQRTIRSIRRSYRDAELDSGIYDSETSGPYQRESIKDDGRDGLLSFSPDPAALDTYQAASLSLPEIEQVDSATNAEAYNRDMRQAMETHEFGAQVTIKSPEELAEARLFRTASGSGFAVMPDGDVVAVFASPNEPKGGAYAMLQAAVQAGGKKLDAFDTYLPDIYETVGFRPVARVPWNDAFAPETWNKETFAEFNNGEPDIVLFVHDPDYFGGETNVPTVAEWADAVALQDQALEELGKPTIAPQPKLKTKPEDSAALAEDKSKGATEVRGNPEADRAAADELRKVKTLASRRKPSDIVESTAYNRVADVASTRASRGQGNINNALPFEAPSSADDRGFVYQVQDKYIDLKKAIERVTKSRRKQGLTPLLETENPYLGEESMHGIIGNKFNRFEQDEVRPLVDKLTRRNITRQELEEFLVLRHAIERNAHVRKLNAASKEPRADLQDGGAGSLNGQRLLDDYVKQQMRSQYGMTWNDSTKSWEGGNRKAAIMNDLANDFDAITRGTLQELKDSGLINQDSLNKLQGYYKYYAPLRGVSPDEDVAIEEHARISKSSNNLSIKGVETEKAKGRVSEASPPLGQIIFQRQNAIRRGTINDVVGQRMLNVIRENPNDDYWKIHTDRKYADITGTELLGVKEDGKQFFIEFKDPRLREAMLSLDGVQSGKIVGMLRYVNRILSAVNTSLNPEFMFGNFFRDLGTALGNVVGEQTMVDGKAIDTKGLKRAIISDTVPSIRQVYRGLRGKKLSGKLAQDWKEYLESGAKTEWFYVKSPEESAATVDELIEMSQGTFKGNVRAGKKAVGNLIEDLNGAVENGVRFAVFKKARDAFIKNGLSRELAVAKAATLSKNLTVNFNRMGNRGELLNGLYLFFNASVQGTANFLRGMSSPAKQRMLLAMVSFGALITRLNELSSEEDEDLGESYYSQIEPWVKERNLILMKSAIPGYDGPPEEYYTIPLPYGYNVLHVLGVNIAENMMGIESVQDSAGELVAASLGSFMPVGFGTSENPLTFLGKGLMPQIGKPFVEIAVNENFFGAPVYTENFDFGPNIPAANRAKQSTPKIFKNTTRFLNELTGGNESMGGDVIDLGWISPDVLDHFFNTITGGLGATVERSGKAIGAGRDYLQGNYVEGDITLNDIPFVRRAMREVTGRESQSQYYDRRDDIYAYDRQLNLLRGADRGAFVRANRPRLLMKRVMDSSDKRLRNINRRLATIRDRILTSTSMENTIRLEEEEKRLQDLKQSTYDRFNKLFNERVGRTE